MQRFNIAWLSLLAVLFFSMSSCEVVGDIFKAGAWSALILVAIVVVVVIWLISKFRK